MINIKESAAFGLTVALSYKAGIPEMISKPIGSTLSSTLGYGLAGDISTIVAFGAIAYAFNGFVWPYVRDNFL